MPKFLSYDKTINEVKTIEVPVKEGSYNLQTRRINDKIIIEFISDPHGKIATAKELARDAKLTYDEIRSLIESAHDPKK